MDHCYLHPIAEQNLRASSSTAWRFLGTFWRQKVPGKKIIKGQWFYSTHIKQNRAINFSKEEQIKLTQVVTVLSGVEALIVNKDVNGIENEESNELLGWAVRMILKGMQHKKADEQA